METRHPTEKVLLVVDDLLFLSRILETARQLNVPVETVEPGQLEEKLAQEAPPGIILDLNHRSGQALRLLALIKRTGAANGVPVIGFLSHVQSNLAQAARDAGCDRLLARSAFSQHLPRLLQELSGRK
jgi:CheY-like chemotaxis protein